MRPQLFRHRIRTFQNYMVFSRSTTEVITAMASLTEKEIWLCKPRADACAFAPLGTMLAEISDMRHVRTMFANSINRRCQPQHATRRVFEKAGNTTTNALAYYSSAAKHSSISDAYFSFISLRNVRQTIQVVIVPNGTPIAIGRTVPSTAPTSTRGGRPNTINTTRRNPTIDDHQHLSISQVITGPQTDFKTKASFTSFDKFTGNALNSGEQI